MRNRDILCKEATENKQQQNEHNIPARLMSEYSATCYTHTLATYDVVLAERWDSIQEMYSSVTLSGMSSTSWRRS